MSESEERQARMLELAREEFVEADEMVGEAERKLHEARERRTLAARIIRLYDPDAPETAGLSGKKKKELDHAKRHRGSSRVGEENREKIADWLREHEDDPRLADGFHPRLLEEHPEWPKELPNRSGISSALPVLADEGVIRLDRIGWVQQNGVDPARKGRAAHIYKVVKS